MKNVPLVGACLALFALVAHVGSDLGLTMTEPLFELDGWTASTGWDL